MDHYADDLAALTAHLDLKNADPCRPLDRRRRSRALPGAARRKPRGEGGDHQRGAAADGEDGGQSRRPAQGGLRRICRRSSPPTAPSSTTICRPGRSTATTGRARRRREPVIWNWWRQGMMGGAKAHYDGIVAFSQTDFTEDLKKITVPVLVMHGDDDQIVPYADSAPLSAKLLKNGTLKTYQGFPHGMPTTEAETINRTCSRSSRAEARGGGRAARTIIRAGRIWHVVRCLPVRRCRPSPESAAIQKVRARRGRLEHPRPERVSLSPTPRTACWRNRAEFLAGPRGDRRSSSPASGRANSTTASSRNSGPSQATASPSASPTSGTTTPATGSAPTATRTGSSTSTASCARRLASINDLPIRRVRPQVPLAARPPSRRPSRPHRPRLCRPWPRCSSGCRR